MAWFSFDSGRPNHSRNKDTKIEFNKQHQNWHINQNQKPNCRKRLFFLKKLEEKKLNLKYVSLIVIVKKLKKKNNGYQQKTTYRYTALFG